MAEAAGAGQTLFRAPLTPGAGLWGYNPATNLSFIEEYPHAKFHLEKSSGLDFYGRYTHTHTHTHTHTQTNKHAHTQTNKHAHTNTH
jgi:hypothetical protein